METLESSTQCLLFVTCECDKNSESLSQSESSVDNAKARAYILVSPVICESYLRICQLFTKSGVEILSGQESPALRSAILNDQVEVIELILAKGKVSKRPRVLVEVGNVGIVRVILGKYFCVTKMKRSPSEVCSAVDETNSEILVKFLTGKPDISYRNPRGGTLLHLAVLRNDVLLVQVLLELGACVEFLRNDGSTSFHLAVQKNSTAVNKSLVKQSTNGPSCQQVANVMNSSTIVNLLRSKSTSLIETSDLKLFDGSSEISEIIADDRSVSEVSLAELSDLKCLNQSSEIMAGVSESVGLCKTSFTETGDLKLQDKIEKNEIIAETSKVYVSPQPSKNSAVSNIDAISLSLHEAVEKGLVEKVKQLLEIGANINELSPNGRSALQLAVDKDRIDIVESLLNHNLDLNDSSNKKVLREAILRDGQNSDKIVRMLLKHGMIIGEEDINNTALFHKAVQKNYLEVVRQLLKHGAKVDETFEYTDCEDETLELSPLILAVRCASDDMIRLLLDNGADVDFRDEWNRSSPILEAVKNSNLSAVRTLLVYNANIKNHAEVLHTAVREGDKEIVEELLKNGAHPNDWNPDEKWCSVAIVIAAKNNDLEMIDLLLKYGANINDQDGEGDSPLVVASEYDCLPVIEYLIRNNADLEIKNFTGTTPIGCAASSGNFKAVDLLLKVGARYDYKTKRGGSPLHWAVAEGHEMVFQQFLDHGFTNKKLLSGTGICKLFSKSWIDRRPTIDYFRSFYNDHRHMYKKAAMRLARHMIKMKAAGLSTANRMPEWYFKEMSQEDFQKKCKEEIVRMKTQYFDDTEVSVYNILTSDLHLLTGYARNSSIVNSLEGGDFIRSFPIYASVINCQLHKGVFQRDLLKNGTETFNSVFKKFAKLPDYLVEKIFGCLRNQEIIVFMNAVSPMLIE